MSDRTVSPRGKKRHYILAGAVILLFYPITKKKYDRR